MATRIDISLLRAQLDRLLREVEARRGELVDLDADHYWLIDGADALDLSQEPELAVGQLSDDAAELLALASRSSEELVVWHDLKHLVGLLDALASTDLPREG